MEVVILLVAIGVSSRIGYYCCRGWCDIYFLFLNSYVTCKSLILLPKTLPAS